MGKIRLKTIGDESQEIEAKKKLKDRREQKTLRDTQDKKMGKAPGLKGGENIVTVGPSEEELQKAEELQVEGSKIEEKDGKKGKSKFNIKKTHTASRRYSDNATLVAKKTAYPLKTALEILKKFKSVKFDETVELHINVKEKGINGQMTLPHGTGKTLKVKIADDALIAQIEKGKIDFDILVATPEMMPKLARVARVLGPRGLMPNPKSGTISEKPEDVVKKLSLGQISFKTESGAPIIHLSIGKLSFDEKQLSENIKEVTTAIKVSNINNATLKSTMSPAIKITV
ncbi:MAG: hypothetical protein COU27_01805 [Candidatus Levybacteria bacterium CG10_big_fil_rev_8_21_14_0_10_36_7]|nr:MAG: hypothetical protein COU27_01805 [Candidatus Levybacteria bacterium CG10_big_fil_rev_8_21_14_0_10_36_7]